MQLLPQTPLPRATSIGSNVLKALGFYVFDYILSNAFRRTIKRPKTELPKRVFHHSRLQAACLSIVHLVPIGLLIFLIYINYFAVFYGGGLSVFDRSDALYFTLFQITAKAIEMVCINSLSAILLQVLRFDLTRKEGVSLGLLTMSSWFSSPVYLISSEYLSAVQLSLVRWWYYWDGSIRSGKLNTKEFWICWRKTRMVLLLFCSITISALIGPASAVLLIPRDQSFPAGGTSYSLNATFDELWPSQVSSEGEYQTCAEPNATLYSVCPSGGYSSFRYQDNYNTMFDATTFTPSTTADQNIWFDSSLVLDRFGIFPPILTHGATRLGARPWMPTYVSQPHMYTAAMQALLTRDWMVAAKGDLPRRFVPYETNFKFAKEVQVSSFSTNPLTHVRCNRPQNVSVADDTAEFHYIKFQPLALQGWSGFNDTKTVNITALRRDPSMHVRTQWIPLPADEFPLMSTGLVLELPWSFSGNTSSRLMITCSISATWSFGVHARSPISNSYAWYIDSTDPLTDGYTRNISTNASVNDITSGRLNRHVALAPDWLDLLTPPAPDPPSTNDTWRPTTLENILFASGFDTLMKDLRTQTRYWQLPSGCALQVLEDGLTDIEVWQKIICDQQDKLSYIERLAARIVTDGLSRRQSYLGFRMPSDLRSWQPFAGDRNPDYFQKLLKGKPTENAVTLLDPQYVVQRLNVSVTGYGYRASTTSDYLATCLVVMYLLIATIHVLYTVSYNPVTSNAWSSMLELVVLAFNSTPTPILRGASADIRRWGTYRYTSKVRAEEMEECDGVDSSESELHLRLLIEDDPAGRTSCSDTATDNLEHSDEASGVMLGTAGKSMSMSQTLSSAVGVAQRRGYSRIEIDEVYY